MASFNTLLKKNNLAMEKAFNDTPYLPSDGTASSAWKKWNKDRASYNRTFVKLRTASKHLKTEKEATALIKNRKGEYNVDRTIVNICNHNISAINDKLNHVKKGSAEEKALSKRLSKYKKNKSKYDGLSKKTKATISKMTKNKANRARKRKVKATAKLAKDLVSSVGDNYYIMPKNPSSKSSIIPLKVENASESTSGNFTEYPVEKGAPLSDFGMAGQRQATVTARIYGKKSKSKKSGWDLAYARKLYKRMRKWGDASAPVYLHSNLDLTNGWLTACDEDKDSAYYQYLHVTLTVSSIRLAKSKSSSVNSKGKKSKKGGSRSKYQQSSSYYSIKSGDSYAKIAKRFNIKVSTLKKWNGFGNKLPAGKRLRYK